MVCFVKLNNGSIKGWIIAQDLEALISELRARIAFDAALQRPLEALRGAFPAGKHVLGGGYVLLVD